MIGESQLYLSVFSPIDGWGLIFIFSPVILSCLFKLPLCHCTYTMLGLPGSVAGWCPSPPSKMNQSEFLIPCILSVLDGAPCVLLSCVPPYIL